MKQDSCRKCGNEMQINLNCKICEKPIEFFCNKCSNTTEKQIHSGCMIISLVTQ